MRLVGKQRVHERLDSRQASCVLFDPLEWYQRDSSDRQVSKAPTVVNVEMTEPHRPHRRNVEGCGGQEEHEAGNVVGLDVDTGEACDPVLAGVFDNYLVKKQILQGAPVIASQLLLVDEVMRAGRGAPSPPPRHPPSLPTPSLPTPADRVGVPHEWTETVLSCWLVCTRAAAQKFSMTGSSQSSPA